MPEAIYDNPKMARRTFFYQVFHQKQMKIQLQKGNEAGIFLIPLAPGLEDTNELRELYFEK